MNDLKNYFRKKINVQHECFFQQFNCTFMISFVKNWIASDERIKKSV